MADPFDLLNHAVQQRLCTTEAIWHNNNDQVLSVAFNQSPVYDAENDYKIADEEIRAECESIYLAGMLRDHEITVSSQRYCVQHIQYDGNGWAVIILEIV